MNIQQFSAAIKSVKADNPVQYAKALQPIQQARYEYLAKHYKTHKGLIEGMVSGDVDRYDISACKLYRELRSIETINQQKRTKKMIKSISKWSIFKIKHDGGLNNE